MFRTLILLVALLAPAAAATCTWNGGAGDWTDAGKWTGGVPTATDIADLSAGGTIEIPSIQYCDRIVAVLTADLVMNSAADASIQVNAANGLTISSLGGFTATFNNPVRVGAMGGPALNQTWDIACTVTLNNELRPYNGAGATTRQALTKTGSGLLIFRNQSAWSSMTVSAGTVRSSHVDGLGTASPVPITVENGATVEMENFSAGDPTFTLNDGATLRGLGTATLQGGNLTLTTGGTATIGYGSATDVFTIQKTLLGQGSLIIAGDVGTIGGKVVLEGNSSGWKDGNLTVQQYATLQATGSSNSLGIATGATGVLTVANGGTLILAATASTGPTFARPLTISGDGVDGTGALIGVSNSGNNITLGGGLVLAANASLGGTGNYSMITGPISGAFDLAKLGSGSWDLRGDSTAWGGNITVTTGTLVGDMTSFANVLGDAIGTTVVQDGATLRLRGSRTSPEPITVTGSGVGGQGALQGPNGTNTTSPISSGAITLTGATTIGVTASDSGTSLRLSGAISGAHDLTIACTTGGGFLRFQGDNSGFTGDVLVSSGRLYLDHANALGDTVGTTTVTAGGSLYIAGGLTIGNESLFLNGTAGVTTTIFGTSTNEAHSVWQGAITLSGPCYVKTHEASGSNLNLTISGQIGGSGSVIYSGPGQLILSGNNTFTGDLLATAGTLTVSHANALGTTAGGTTITGATLSLGAFAIGNEALQLGGRFTTGSTCSWAGPVALIDQASMGGSGTATFSGAISGAQLLEIDGGTYVFNGTNSNSGGLVVRNSSTLVVGAAAGLGDTAQLITVRNATLRASATFSVAHRLELDLAGTIAVDPGFTLTLAGVVSGNGSLTKTLSGTLTLSASNTYTGTTTITTGTLQGTTASLSGDIVNNANLVFDQAFDGTYAGTMSGTGNLTKAGSGTLTLTRASTYTQSTTVSAGVLQVDHPQALGTTAAGTTVATGATLRLNGVTVVGEGLTLNGTGVGGLGALVAVGSGGWTGTVNLAANTSLGGTDNDSAISGVISGTNTLTKTGSGTWTLTGANTYTGQTTVSAGTLVVGNALATGTSAGGVVVASGATLRLGPVAVVTETLSLAGNGVGSAGALVGTGIGSWSGNITLTADTRIGGDDCTTTLSGTIGGGFALTKVGTGTLVTSNAGSTYSGNTTVSQGVWRASTAAVAISSNGPLGNSANAVRLGGGALEVDTATFSRALSVTTNGSRLLAYGADRSVAGAISATGTFVLTLGGNANGLALDGVLSNGSGNLGVLVAGPGSTTLGGVNTYSGGTTVQGGTLRLTGRLTATNACTIASGALLDLASADPNCLPDALTLAMQGGTLRMQAPLDTTRTETVGTLNFSTGTNRIELSANGSGNAQLTAASGYARTAPATLLFTRTAGTTGTANLFLTGVADQTALAWSLVSAGGTTSPGVYTTADGLVGQGSGDIISAQSGNWDDGATWVGGVAPAAGNTATIAADHAIALNGADRTIAGLNFNGGGTLSAGNTLTITGGGLTVSGTGSPTIACALSYGTGSGTILQGSSGTLTISGAISGSGDLVKLGSGTLLLAGANTCGGAGQSVVIQAGALSVDADARLGAAANAVTLAGGTLLTTADLTSTRGLVLGDAVNAIAVSPGTTLTWNGVISGSGSFTKSQAGILALGGANTYTGTTTVAAGLLAADHASALGSSTGSTSVADGAALQVGPVAIAGETLTLAGTGGGAGALRGVGAGSWSGGIVLTADSTLGGDGNTTSLLGPVSGAFALAKTGSGTFILGAANTHAGTTTVAAGTLAVAHALALGGTGSGTSVATGATLRLDGVTVLGEGLTLAGDGVGSTGALLASGTSGWSGAIALAADASIGGTGNDTLLSGIISGGFALTKLGTGSYALTGANTFTGATAIQAGTLVVGHATATGTTAGGVTVADGATLVIDAVAVGAEALTVQGTGVGGLGALQGRGTGSWIGNITLAADTTLGGSGNDTALFTGVISGPGGLIKTGSGTWAASSLNTFTGDVTLQAGTFRVSTNTVAAATNGPLGNSANPVRLAGGALAQNTATFSRGLTVTGDGSTIIAWGATRTMAANITTVGNRTLTIGGTTPYGFTMTGVMSDGTGPLSLIVRSNTQVQTAHTCSGSVLVTDAAVLTFFDGARMPSLTSLELVDGELLIDENNAGGAQSPLDNPDRLGNTMPLIMDNGTIRIFVTTNENRSRQERLGQLSIAGGDNYFVLTSTTHTASLTFLGGVTQSNGGRLTFKRINSSSSSTVFFTGVADDTILPWTTVYQTGLDGPRVGRYTTANGLIASSPIISVQSGNWDDPATWLGGIAPTADDEVTIAGSHSIDLNGADRTANALLFTGSGALTGAHTLTLASGALQVTGTGSPTIDANLSFGTADAQIVQNSTGTLTVNGTIAGSGSLGCVGAGTVALNGINTFGGAGKSVQVGSSTLIVAADTALGDAANSLVCGGSLLRPGNGFTSARAISLVGNLAIDVASGWTATLSGAVTGSGDVTKRNAGTLILSGDSGYSGTTTIDAGTLTVQHANALGATSGGTRVESGASLVIDGVAIGAEPLVLIGSGVGGAGALQAVGTASWAGTAALAGAVTIGGAGSGTLGGTLTGNFNLTKAGSGTWTLGGNNAAYVYAIAFFDGSSGRLIATHGNALGTASSVTVPAGDTLELSGASIPSGKSLTLAGTGTDGNGALIATGAGNGWAGAVALSAHTTIGGTGSGTISGNQSGAFVLTKAGSGTWTLSGTNAMSSVTVNAGILRAAATGSLGSGTTTNNATLELDNASFTAPTALTMNNGAVLRGIGTCGWAGTLTLTTGGTSTFTYSSPTDVMTIASNFSGQGSVVIDGTAGTAGGMVVFSGAHAGWIDGSITVREYATLEGRSNATSLGPTGGTGTITVESGGTVRVVPSSGSNTLFPRPFRIAGDGVGGNGALIGADNAGRFAVIDGGIVLNAAASIGGTGNNTSLRGPLVGTFTLTKRGSGLWESYDDQSAWDGDLVVAAGTFQCEVYRSGGMGLGSAIGTTTVQDGATLALVSGSATVPENFFITGSGVGGIGAIFSSTGTTTCNLSGTITLTGPAAIGAVTTSSDRFILIGSSTIVGSDTLTKVGTGPIHVQGSNLGFTGDIVVAAGTFNVSNTNALGDTGGTTMVQDGATLRLSSGGPWTETVSIVGPGAAGVGALYFSGNGNTWNGPVILTGNATVNMPRADSRIGGVISDGGSGYRLTKIGIGSWGDSILSAANTYSGGTTISQGELRITNPQALGTPSPTATVTVASGATLRLNLDGATLGAYPLILSGTGDGGLGALRDSGSNGTTTSLPAGASITLAADATITVVNASHTTAVADVISGGFSLTKAGPGILTLAGNSSGFTGGTLISAGTVRAQHGNALGTSAGTVTVTSGANLTLDNALIPAGKPLSIAGTGISSAGALIAVGTSSWGGPATLTAATTIAGAAGSSGSIDGVLSGAFDLTKIGAGSWRLAGDNSGFSNLITLSAGRLVAAHDHALGSNAALTVPSGCILELAGANVPAGKTLTIAGNGGGATTGALIATGAGNGWGGPVVLSAATTIGGTGSGTISGTVSGLFNLTKCSSGTWTLAGDNSGYANTIAFQDGTSGRLVAAHNNALGTAAGLTVPSGDVLELDGASIPAGKTLTLSGTGDGSGALLGTNTCAWGGAVTLAAATTIGGSGSGTIAGNIGGAFPLTKTGAGTWTLGGTNAYTTSIINAGILAITGTAGSGDLTVNAGGTLAGTGTAAGAVVLAGGSVAPGTAAGSIGTLTLGGTLSGTGTLLIALSGASSDRIHTTAGASPVTLTNLALSLGGLPTATATILSFPNATHATTFTSVTGLHPSCTGPNYLPNSVTIEPASLDLVFTGNCTGTGTAVNRVWALGVIVPGSTASSESGYLSQVFELRSDSSYLVDVHLSATDAIRTLGGGTNWTRAAAAGADQCIIEMKPAAGAWTNLTVPRLLAGNLAVGGTQAFDLRFTAPTASTDADQKTLTVTATASIRP